MSDVPDGSGQIARRRPRPGDGGAPVSGALAIVLAVIAVVAGYLILRSISDDSGRIESPSAGNGAGVSTPSSTDPTQSSVSTSSTTTVPQIVTTGASVLVVNANGRSGSAGEMSTALSTVAGFDTVDPMDRADSYTDLEISKIFYVPTNPQAKAVADSLNIVMGGDLTVAPLEGEAPTSDGTTNDADVVLMLAKDKDQKTLAELNPTLSGTPTGTNPPVAGATSSTTTPPG